MTKLWLEIVQIRGHYRCTYIDGTRVHGGKPYVSEGPSNYFAGEIDADKLLAAMPEVRNAISALKKIASGGGTYGAQAAEYKAIARAALEEMGEAYD